MTRLRRVGLEDLEAFGLVLATLRGSDRRAALRAAQAVAVASRRAWRAQRRAVAS